MYVCMNNACGEVFEEPATHRETHGFQDGSAEVFFYCPHCGCNNYQPAALCRRCYEYREEGDVYRGLCFECVERLFTAELGLSYIEQPNKTGKTQEGDFYSTIRQLGINPDALEDWTDFAAFLIAGKYVKTGAGQKVG